MSEPLDFEIVVIGPYVWGKGKTLSEALNNASRPKEFIAYVAPPDTKVDEMGSLSYLSDSPFAPTLIEDKRKKKKS